MPMPQTPVEQRRRLGNPSKRPLPSPEETGTIAPAFHLDVPEPERPLGLAGRVFWDKILPAAAAWIAESDLELLLQTAELIDEQQALRMHVLDPVPRRDQWRDRSALRKLDRQIVTNLAELGLTPTARTRLGLAQVQARAIAQHTERETRPSRFNSDKPQPEPTALPQIEIPRPYKSWTKHKILDWCQINGVEVNRKLTKNQILAVLEVPF